jgi:esterase/lipase
MYVLDKIIPLKHLGKHISKSIVLSYSSDTNENARKELIKTIISLFDSSKESLEERKERVIKVFENYELDTTFAKSEFNEFIETIRQAKNNILKKKGKDFLIVEIS